MTICGRTNGTEIFVREPGRTAGPSAALGMTKGRAVRFVRNRQIGSTERTAGPSAALRSGQDDDSEAALTELRASCWSRGAPQVPRLPQISCQKLWLRCMSCGSLYG